MIEDNIILHFSEDNKKRQLFVKKIKLSDFPDLSKKYNDFFNNDINYFNNKYKNNYIVVGKIQENKDKEEIIAKMKNNKGKYKKYLINSSKFSNSRMISEDSSAGEKKLINKYIKDTSLKIGQQYIDENNLEDLFNKFKTVKKINKSKTRNFITVKDLIENKIKINSFKNHLKIENNEIRQFGKSSDNNEYNRTISTKISNSNLIKQHLNESKKIFMNNNYTRGYSSYKNILPKNEIKDKTIDKKYLTTTNFYEVNRKKTYKGKIKKRNKIINKQNQFLLSNKDTNYYINKSEKKYFAELLANQEQTLLKSSKTQIKFENLTNKISKKINKSKKDLLILNTDNYRIKYELLNNFDIFNKHIGPEHYYNWYDDLRSLSNGNEKNDIYSIRNPLHNEKKFKINKKILTIKNIKKIINEVNKKSHNCKGLIVEGQDLLQLEYDYAKSLKNKKKINNFESYLPSIDIEDKFFAGKKQNSKKI